MKHLLIYIFLLSGISIIAQEYTWESLSHPQMGTLHRVHFFDENEGIIGESGLGYLKTTDGGESWQWEVIPLEGYTTFISMQVIDNEIIYVGAAEPIMEEQKAYGRLLKSTDRGSTWAAGEYRFDGFVNKIIPLNKDTIVVEDFWLNLYITKDSGETWEEIGRSVINNVTASDIKFINNELWILSSNSHIYVSNDLGESWTLKTENEDIEARRLIEVNNNIYILGNNGLYKYSEDNGVTWQLKTVGNNTHFNIIFQDDDYGLLIGDAMNSGLIYITKDGGESWHEEKTENIFFLDGDIIATGDVFLVGAIQSGSSTTGILAIGKKAASVMQANSNDISIYPNPASEYIEVQLWDKGLQPLVPEGSHITITNMIGVEVVTEVIQPTIQSHRINISHLPRGVYFLRIGSHVEKFVKW